MQAKHDPFVKFAIHSNARLKTKGRGRRYIFGVENLIVAGHLLKTRDITVNAENVTKRTKGFPINYFLLIPFVLRLAKLDGTKDINSTSIPT